MYDTQEIINQLNRRKLDQFSKQRVELSSHFKFLTSSTDNGVWRNGGRRGANFAPLSILNSFEKLPPTKNSATFSVHEVSSDKNEILDFIKSQEEETQNIKQIISDKENIIQLGGGHDHIYPLLKSFENKYKKIKVINLDAHCDTRIDELPHSGTPFRQFDQNSKCDFEIVQMGINLYNNSVETLSELKNGNMKIISLSQLQKETVAYSTLDTPILCDIFKHEEDELIVLSIDCDVLDVHSMPGVSATNPHGLSKRFVNDFTEFYFKTVKNQKVIGIYEYNPIYDDLTNSGSKFIAQLIWKLMNV